MSSNIEIRGLMELIREDLQIGWSHVEDGNEDFALHHLGSALRKVEEIKQLKGCEEHQRSNQIQTQPPLTINDTKGNRS